MRCWILFIAASAFQSVTDAIQDFPFPTQPKALHEVFQVDTRADWNHNPSSCAKPLPRDAGGYGGYFIGVKMYDSEKGYENREDNILNHVWWQTNTMIKYARAALIAGQWYKIPQMHSLAFSFFGIYPGGDETDYEPDEEADAIMLNELRGRYIRVHESLERAQPDGPTKPKMFCDGGYGAQQNADSPAKDKDGRTIRNSDGSAVPLAEWERMHGRNFQDSWYFWYDIDYESGNEKGYLVLDREDHPAVSDTEQYPWPVGSTGQPNPCEDGIYAEVFHPVTPTIAGGTEAWHVGDHIVLCPRSFADGKWPIIADDIDRMRKQAAGNANHPGQHLDFMGVVGGTLAHEVVHVFIPEKSDDAYPYFPKREGNTRTGAIHPDFPTLKSGFSQARVRHHSEGAMQSMSIAMYEFAQPTTAANNIVSIYTPESMMWFARTAWLTVVGRQDWSIGYCRAFGDVPPLAGGSAPIVEPPDKMRRLEVAEGELAGNRSDASAFRIFDETSAALVAPVA